MRLNDLTDAYRLRTVELLSLVRKGDVSRYLSQYERDFNRLFARDYLHYYEWMSRSYRCSKHMLGAALYYCQAKHLGVGALSNVTAYALYYSLHHAVSSVLVLMPHISYRNLNRISHDKCLTAAKEELENRHLAPPGLQDVYNRLIALREVFSYRVPLGSLRSGRSAPELPSIEKASEELDAVLPPLLQLGNVLSYALYLLSQTLFGGIEDRYDELQTECDEVFFGTIEIEDRLGRVWEVDDDDYWRFGWVFRKVVLPYPQDWILTEKFCEDLECGWWEMAGEQDFDISTVGNVLATWLQ